MTTSRFWRVMAVALLAAFMYVGHGLHSGPDFALPSLTNEARADGVAAVHYAGKHSLVITASPDGRQIYVWDTTTYLTGSDISFVGTYSADD